MSPDQAVDDMPKEMTAAIVARAKCFKELAASDTIIPVDLRMMVSCLSALDGSSQRVEAIGNVSSQFPLRLNGSCPYGPSRPSVTRPMRPKATAATPSAP